MADATTVVPKPAPRKRGSWWRVLGWIFAVVMVVLVTVYFVVTSSAFLQKHILPRVSRSIHADVTVGSAVVHPFSEIVLRDLKIQPTNQPTLLTAREVRAKYSLLDILGGNIRVDEVVVTSPTIQIVENADAHTSNLDPLLKSQEKPAKAGKASKLAKVDIRKVTLSNASISRIQNHRVGTRDLVELTNVSVTISGVRNNGEAGKVEFAAIVRDENNPPAPAMYGLLEAKVNGSFSFSLTPDLGAASLLGDAHLDISQAAGSFSDFAKLVGKLHCDVSAAEIKSITLNFEKGGAPLGEVRASGPFDPQKSEGRFNVELLSVDKQVLNLFGAKGGIDFGSTTITSTNRVELTKAGKAISAVGQLSASKFQVSLTNQSTPPIDLLADYDVSVDKAAKRALVGTLHIAGTQKGRPLLRGELTSPMTVSWGSETNAVGDSSFSFAVTKLNIADWKTFAGDLASAGTVDLNAKLLSQQGGTRLTFDVTNQIQNLAVNIGGQHFSDATMSFKTHGVATNLKQFDLRDFGLQVARSNRAALTISGSGTYNRTNASADLQVALQASIGRVLQLLGQTNFAASGNAELKARVTQKGSAQTVAGTLTLTNFAGKIGASEVMNFGVNVALDMNKTPEQIEIRNASGGVSQGKNRGGDFVLSGIYSLMNKPSQLTATLTNFNENGLRPFLEPMLAGRKLVSVAASGSASAQLNANGDSAVKADLQVINLVVNDPAQQLAATPLEARLWLDARVTRKIADVRELQIALTPTQRAKNEFQLRGRVDMSRTNAMQGNLTLASDGLDLTSYYDLFAATNAPVAKAGGRNKPQNASATAAPTVSAGGDTNQLPFRKFTVDANVREFYLREIAATNFQAHVLLDGSHVLLKPFELTLNGSPMRATADVDLSVPGYKYALTFYTTNAPFAPLWNTFKPDQKGNVGGTLTALVDISGVGTTGESLQKTLTGTFDIGTTNLNLAVEKIRNPALRLVVAVVAKVPDLLGNPAGTAESIAVGAVGRGAEKFTGGLASDVGQSPIDVIMARGTAGNGKVILQRALMRSTVFEGDVTNGTITLASVLTNSPIDIPVGIALSKSIAQHIPTLASAETSTNENYVRLPDFFSETGTLGGPKPKINVISLGKETLQQLIPGLGGGTNGAAGNLLQGIGGLLNGGGNTNQPGTNEPPAKKEPPVNDLLNRLLGK